MRGSRLVLLLGALVVSLSCGDSRVLGPRPESPTSPTDAPAAPDPAISDAEHAGGNEHFFWLPPMVENPESFNGDFDPTLSPVVRICDLSDCAGLGIAEFTMDTGPGSETVRLVAADEHYIVNWHTDEFDVSPGPTYRIVASVAGAVLGYADIVLAMNGNEAKNLTTQESIGLKDGRTLPIKFRIEEGAVFVVSADAGATIDVLGGLATVEVPAGAVDEPTGIVVTPVAPVDEEIVTIELSPAGTTFNTPLTVTLAYDEADLGGIDENDLALNTLGNGEWVIVNGFTRDPATNTISAPFHHFSKASVGPASKAVVCSTDGNPHTFDIVADGLAAVMPGGTVSICAETQMVDDVTVTRPVTVQGRGSARPVIRTTIGHAGFHIDMPGSGTVAFRQVDFENDSPRDTNISPARNTYSIRVEGAYDQLTVDDVTFTTDAAASGGLLVIGDAAAPGGRLEVLGSSFTGALVGLNLIRVPDFLVSASTFGNHDPFGVLAQIASGRVEHSTFGPDCGRNHCLMIQGAGQTVDVVGNTFQETRTDGLIPGHEMIWVRTSSTAHIEDNDFEGCGAGTCIRATGGSLAEIVNNRFTIDSSHGTEFAIHGEDGSGGTRNPWFAAPTLIVEDNTITGVGTDQNGYAMLHAGIEAQSGAMISAYRNSISNASAGIAGYLGGVITDARDNVIDNVRYGFGVWLDSQVSASFNDITNVAEEEVAIPDSDPTLSDVTCNWWGNAAGPQGVDPGLPAALYTPFAGGPIAGSGATSCTGGAFVVDGSGGTVNAAGGAAALDVPAGALSSQTAIVVDPTSNHPGDQGLLDGTVYDFQPDGTSFATPATLTLSYAGANLNGLQPADLTILTEENGEWIELASTVDTNAETVTAQIDGFSKKGVGGKVATVDVTPSSDTIDEGETLQLTATPKDAAGNPMNRKATWTSLDTNIATVDNTGLVTGVAAGTVTIEANSGGAAGLATIIVVAPGQVSHGTAYVALGGGDEVAIINTATNAVVGTIAVGTQPTGVAASPDGSHLYVANVGSSEVSVINTASGSVVATVGLPDQPVGVDVTPDGSAVYVTTQNSFTVTVIDVATNTVSDKLPLAAGGGDVRVTPDGAFAYVPGYSGQAFVVATSTNTLAATISGIRGGFLDITPDGSFTYVANQITNDVAVVDVATNTVVTTIPVGGQPRGIAVTPDGLFAYVGNRTSNDVSVISTSTNSVVATVSGTPSPWGVAITPDGEFVYVTEEGSWNASIIETASNTLVGTVSLGASATGIAFIP